MYNFFIYKKYEKTKTETGWIVKSVLWKQNSDGEIAYIEELNSDRLLVRATAYSDADFKNLTLTTTRKYSADKSYAQYDIYEQDQGGWQSIIGIFDNKNKQLSCKQFIDKNFENLYCESTKEYNKNGSFQEKTICHCPQCYEIDFYNKNRTLTKVERYKDENFNEIEWICNKNYFLNGKVEDRFEFIENSEYPSKIEIYNNISREKLLKEKFYKDKNFKKLYSTSYYKYFDDGSYEIKTIYAIPQENGLKFVIEKFDKNNNRISEKSEYKNAKEKSYCTIEYLDNGNMLYSKKYNTLQDNKYMSKKWEEDKDYRMLWAKYYTDKNYEKLIGSQTYKYLENDIKIRKIKYEEINLEYRYYSIIEKFQKDKFISGLAYSDKDFQDLAAITHYETNENENIIIKWKFKKVQKNGEYLSCIRIIDKDTNLTKEVIIYRDNNFQEIIGKEERSYESRYNFKIKSVFTKPFKKFILSSMARINKNKIYAEAYYDNNFQNLYRISRGKENKKGERIYLRLYEKTQEDGTLAEIEKFDKNEELMYCKKYKFNGFILKILFFFAR